MTGPGLVALAVAGLACVAFAAGVETGAYALNRARLQLGIATGDWRSRLLGRLLGDLPSLLAAVLVGRAAAHAVVSFAVTLLLERSVPYAAELVAAVVVAPVVFVAGELTPKELFRRHADTFMRVAAPLLAVVGAAFSPLTRLFGLVPRALARFGIAERKEDERSLAAEELRLTIQASAEEGVLTNFQAALARNILSLKHRLVANAMVPLTRSHGVEVGTLVEDARRIAARAGRSRLYVYRGVPEEAIGAVALYDLFLDGKAGSTVEALTRPVPRFRPRDRVEDALLRLRIARETLAIVADERGRAIGIVTLKDLCEEITGELDEL